MHRPTAILLAGLAACGQVTFRSGRGGGLPNPDGTLPDVTAGGGRNPGAVTAPGRRESRRTVCRNLRVPRGWVAIDYLADRNCGGSAREPYSAVVLQLLEGLPVRTVLLVCRGQTIPIDWSIDRSETENP